MRRCTCTIMCTTRPGLTMGPPHGDAAVAEGSHWDGRGLVHVDGAGDGAATKAELLRGRVVVNAAADVDGEVAGAAIWPGERAVAFADLCSGVGGCHRDTSV